MTSPTEAHQATVALLHRVLLEVARRRQDELPGLEETLQDDILLTTGGTTRRVHGEFAEDVWRFGERRVHELFLNADRSQPHPQVSPAEDVFVTLLHEGCHAWALMNGIKDTSRGGLYHNRRFAGIALQIGLAVQKDATIGHRTPSLSPWARVDYADLLSALEGGLLLGREPVPVKLKNAPTDQDDRQATTTSTDAPQPSRGRYVFASCQCRSNRRRPLIIRVARGSWRPGVICCSVCQSPFVESLTTQDQSGEG